MTDTLSLGNWFPEGTRAIALSVVVFGSMAGWQVMEEGLNGEVPADYITQLSANTVPDKFSLRA